MWAALACWAAQAGGMDRVPVDVANLHLAVSLRNPLVGDRVVSSRARARLEELTVHRVDLACVWTAAGHVLLGRVGGRVVETDPVPLVGEVERGVWRLAEQLLDRCAPLIHERTWGRHGGA